MPASRRKPNTTLGKLSPPRVARAFPRKRLFAVLDRYADRPVTWIAGPPGSGKTTLVSSWLEARKHTAVWVQLDPGDSDPATFFHYLTIALAGMVGRSKNPLLGFTNDDRRDVLGFARRYFRRVAELLEPPWVVVLDNYQEIADDSSLHASLAAIIDELPRRGRWVVISRVGAPPPFARAMSNQQLGGIDAAGLRFSLDETSMLVGMHGKTRSASELHKIADGWAAGMVLMLAAKDLDSPSPVGAGATNENVFDYFAAEVLAKMPPAHQNVLMRVAFLPSATEAMAVAISGEAEAGKVLASLARRSLFTDRRTGGESVYVFHALFTAFLQARAADALTREALGALRTRAGEILADQGQIDRAIEHFVAAGAWADASRLIDASAVRYLEQGRAASVREWIAHLPDALRQSPRNMYWLGRCALGVDPEGAIDCFTKAFDQFEREADAHGALLSAAGAAESIAFEGMSHEPLVPWIEAFERLAPAYFESHDADTEFLVLPGMLAAFSTRQPTHRLTIILADRAARLLDDGRFANHYSLIGSLAYAYTQRGEVPRYDALRRKLDESRATSGASPLALMRWYAAAIFFKAVVGDTAGARADAEEAIQFLEKHPAAPLRVRILLRAAQGAWVARDAATARRVLDQAKPLIGSTHWIDRSVYEHMRGNIALLECDTAGAVRHFNRCLDAASRAGRPSGETTMTCNAALAAIQHGDYEQAEVLLKRARSNRSYLGSRINEFGGSLVEAHLADRRGERERCLDALRDAFRMTRESGINFEAYVYVLEGLMSRLCALALEHDIEVPIVRQVIRSRGIPPPNADVPGWPWAIRLFTLGGFRIERDGEPLPASRKEMRKPIDMLKLVIASGGGSTSQLTETLWPDAEGDRARLSFDGTLRRLRKMLGLEAAVELRNGIVTINPALAWTDVAALEHGFAKIVSALEGAPPVDPGKDASLLLAACERVLALYRGPFLATDDHLPPVVAPRDRLRARFLRYTGMVGDFLESAGRHEDSARLYKRSIEQDVLSEETYRRLIKCQLAQGKRAEAFETYRRCRDNLSIILGMKPSAETERLAAKLRFQDF